MMGKLRWLPVLSLSAMITLGTGVILLLLLRPSPERATQTAEVETSISQGTEPSTNAEVVDSQKSASVESTPSAESVAAKPVEVEERYFRAVGVMKLTERTEAPDFTLEDPDGKPVSLKDFRGKVIFLNFWATWCPPCRLEMPSMEKLYQEFKDQGFIILAVSIDRQEGVVKPFMRELKLTFPALLDSTSEVASMYGLRGLPTTYLISHDGIIIGGAVGARQWFSEEAKSLIKQLLQHDLK